MTMQRRNLYKSGRPIDELAGELLSIAELQARADGGMRMDAPLEAALARERLVRLYRRRGTAGPYLDLYRPRRERSDPWGDGDVEGLAWLCRLADAGHIGAARIADRALHGYARLMSAPPLASEPVFQGSAGCRLMCLANRHSRVARALAMIEAFRPDTDIAALADWLELAGDVHANLAREIRELVLHGVVDFPEELQLIRRRARSEFDRSAMEFHRVPLAISIANQRLERHRAKPLEPHILEAALAILEKASAAGSSSAEETLWLFRYQEAGDKARFVREWLGSGAKTPHRCQKVSLVVAMALDEGLLGGPPDENAAIPWYSSAVRSRLSGNPVDGATCARIADATASTGNFALAFRWLERGIALRDSECVAQWMEIRTREKTGVGLDVDAVLAQARAQFTLGGSIPDSYSLEKARMRASIYHGEKLSATPPDPVSARKWLEVCALLGDTDAAERLTPKSTT